MEKWENGELGRNSVEIGAAMPLEMTDELPSNIGHGWNLGDSVWVRRR